MEEAVTNFNEKKQEPPDAMLFVRIAAGEEEAFAAFYRLMVPQMRPFIYSITRSDAQVDEVIQESFLRFWLNRDKLPSIHNPQSWLFKITANICYSHFQKALTEKKALHIVGERTQDTYTEGTDQIQLRFLKAALQEGVAKLSPQRKKIYQLNREQGLTVEEIAEQLGLSVQTVRNTLSASLESLREHLARNGYIITLIPFLILTR